MIMKQMFYFLLLFFSSQILFANQKISNKEYYRISECIRIIDKAGISYWPSLVGFRGPWVYVTNEGQYLVNHKKKWKGFKPTDLSNIKNPDKNIFNIQWRNKQQVTLKEEDFNSDPVFVFNSISTNKKDLDYNFPITYASSIEIVKKVVPLKDTEDWMSLFLHEVFHQFQFSNKDIFSHFEQLKSKDNYLDSTELADIYKKHDWYKLFLLEENRLLLKARNTKEINQKKKHLLEFFEIRKKRREKYFHETGKDIAELEAFWELIEGGARYFEYATFRVLKGSKTNLELKKYDTLYGGNRRYTENINIDLMENLDIDIKRTRYFYTTGFNLYLLLEQLNTNYNSVLFSAGPMYAENILLNSINSEKK